MRQPIECQNLRPTYGLMSTCLQAEVNNHTARLRLTLDQRVESLTILLFLYRNYRYKTVAIQIHHDAGLVRYHIDRENLPY